MTDTTLDLLREGAERIFSDHCDMPLWDAAESGEFAEALWEVFCENGYHVMAQADSGLPLAHTFTLLKVAGRHAVPLPLAETLLGARWSGTTDGFVSVGHASDGAIAEVPWGRRADLVLGIADAGVVASASVEGIEYGTNLAGEPRDSLKVSGGERHTLDEDPFVMLALARTAQMAGCLERVLELCLTYANEREQFGRPIAKFQAIQHNLARMAGETAAAGRAADAAIDALGSERFELEVAAAKSRVGEAVGICAEIAHQVHGAMGYAHEHSLHHFTRRLWAWRDEFGNEFSWQQKLGQHLCDLGAGNVWKFLATSG